MGKLIMLIILVLGIAMAVPKTRTMMEAKAKPVLDHFKAKLVPSRLGAMADELGVRVSRGEGYPSSFSHWLEKDFTGSPMDPWGNEYYLKQDRGGFLVGSMGPDGVEGNADDIKVVKKLGR